MLRIRIAIAVLVLGVLGASDEARALPPRGPGAAGSCDIHGEWIGDATDDGGTHWTFPMRVQQTGSQVEVLFTWTSSRGHHGTETARGTIDCATRALELRTVTIDGDDLAAAAYHATLAPDWRSLRGRWDGPGVPSRFTATRR